MSPQDCPPRNFGETPEKFDYPIFLIFVFLSCFFGLLISHFFRNLFEGPIPVIPTDLSYTFFGDSYRYFD